MERREARALMVRLKRDAERIAVPFGLRWRTIEAERAGVRGHYGICYSDGSIRIRLRHATTGRPLKYSSLVNTLCHELAHLRHFDHGPRFQAFYLRLLEYARRHGIYRPGSPCPPAGAGASPGRRVPRGSPEGSSRAPATPIQLALF